MFATEGKSYDVGRTFGKGREGMGTNNPFAPPKILGRAFEIESSALKNGVFSTKKKRKGERNALA